MRREELMVITVGSLGCLGIALAVALILGGMAGIVILVARRIGGL